METTHECSKAAHRCGGLMSEFITAATDEVITILEMFGLTSSISC
jgi:hypothetical protein